MKDITETMAFSAEELKRDNINYSRENIILKKAFKHVEFAHTH